MRKEKYKRVILKIGGEALAGSQGYNIDPEVVNSVAQEIEEVKNCGVEIGIVIGGGNIFRGISASIKGVDRSTADYMGMLATIINALALQDSLEKLKVTTRVQTAIEMERVAEPYIRRRAIRHLEKGRVVIFAGGTGNPYFTTDTTAALRAAEIGAEVVFKATKVDGVYNADPLKNPHAKKFDFLSYTKVIKERFKVIDITAVTLCMENEISLVVFNLHKKGNIKKAILGEKIGTIIGGEES